MREDVIRRLLERFRSAIRSGDSEKAQQIAKAVLEEMNRGEWNEPPGYGPANGHTDWGTDI